MTDMEKLNAEELDQVTGGSSYDTFVEYRKAVVYGTTNYLALRTRAAYDAANEIGKLHNGDMIEVRPDRKDSVYIWARALGKEGWVNGNYVQIINY